MRRGRLSPRPTALTSKYRKSRALRPRVRRPRAWAVLARLSHPTAAIAMNHLSSNPGFPSRAEQLLSRARRAQQRGERRQALVALREAALVAEIDARLWALYGSACAKAGRG